MRRVTFGVGALLALGCGGETAAPGAGGPTYHTDVAPILAQHCRACHSADGVALFPFDDFAQASSAAAAIADATSSGRMPPWHVEDDGSCRSFIGGPTITDLSLIHI